jgi:uncharacterized protein YndB with AHSA1/START domain
MTDTTTAPAQTRTLVIEREMPHPPAKIWRALTEGPLIDQWLMSNDFQPTVGHKFTFRSDPVQGWDGIINSEVLAVDPPSSLSYQWNSMGLGTVVLWTLTPSATGTQVRMEQSGFSTENDYAYKGATYGWTNFITKLEGVVAGLA